MDFDPRDYDNPRDRRDDDERDRDHDDALTLGRGPGSHKLDAHHDDPRDRHEDWREARDRDGQDRDVGDRDSLDPRDVFVRDLDRPRGHERERVLDRDHTYELNGEDKRSADDPAESHRRSSRRTRAVVTSRTTPAQETANREEDSMKAFKPRPPKPNVWRFEIYCVDHCGQEPYTVFFTTRFYKKVFAVARTSFLSGPKPFLRVALSAGRRHPGSRDRWRNPSMTARGQRMAEDSRSLPLRVDVAIVMG